MQLVFVYQQLPGAQGFMVKDVAMLVRADVRVDQPKLGVLYQTVGVLQVGASSADGFHLRASQSDPGFELLQQKVVVRSGAIDRSIALTAGGRVAPGLFLFLRMIACRQLASHRHQLTEAVEVDPIAAWRRAETTAIMLRITRISNANTR